MSALAAEYEQLLVVLRQIQLANSSHGVPLAIFSDAFRRFYLPFITVVAAITLLAYDMILTFGDEVGEANFPSEFYV